MGTRVVVMLVGGGGYLAPGNLRLHYRSSAVLPPSRHHPPAEIAPADALSTEDLNVSKICP